MLVINRFFSQIVLILFVIFPAFVEAGEFVLNESSSNEVFEQYLEYSEETETEYSIGDVVNGRVSFQPLNADQINFGYKEKGVWFKIDFTNKAKASETYILEFGYPLLDQIDVFVVNNQGVIEEAYKLGDLKSFDRRVVNIPDFSVPIAFAENETKRVYFYVKTLSSFRVPVHISQFIHYMSQISIEQIVQGIFYGVAFALLIYNLFIAFYLRDPSYFYYLVFIVACIGFISSIDGNGFRLWPEAIYWQQVSIYIFAHLAIIGGLIFAQSLLETKGNRWIGRLSFIQSSINFFGIGVCVIADTNIAAVYLIVTAMLGTLLMISIGVIRLVQGYKPALHYVLGWGAFLVGVMMLGLSGLGVVQDTLFANYGIQLGMAAQMVLLSLSLGKRINVLKEQQRLDQEAALVAKTETKAKSEFLAKMSHEIRTPMSGVLGMVELMKDTPLNDQQNRYIDTIYNSGEALLGVINDILDYSKIESGKLDLENIEFNLPALIDECGSIMNHKILEKNLNFICTFDPELPKHVVGDPTRVRQIILNFLSNAWKFTDQGNIRINASKVNESPSAESSETSSLIVKFEIVDNGIGISTEQQKSLFQSFSQADSSTTRKYGGTGLGLAICKQLTGLMGGEIGVFSAENKGSTFWFTVAFQSCEQPKVEKLPEGRSLLLVDPVVGYAQMLKNELTPLGLEVVCAETSEAAVSAVRERAERNSMFDVIAVASVLPEVKGMHVIQSLNQSFEIPRDTTVLLTTPESKPDNRHVIKAGIDLVLEKPPSSSLLLKYIKELKNWGETAEGSIQTSYAGYEDIRILVAEDNSVNQMVLTGMLKKLGADATFANNGVEAFEKASEGTFDVIFMDCEMPLLDGYGAARKIRGLTNYIAVPIIALTAHAMLEQKQQCMDAGMNAHLSKPIKLEELKQAIDQWVLEKAEDQTSITQHSRNNNY